MATAPTPLPALSRTDPAFKSKVNALFLSWLPAWTVACNAQAMEVFGIAETVNGYKNAAATSAGTAATQVTLAANQVTLAANQVTLAAAEKNAAAGYAAQAAANAGAIPWVSGAYAYGDVRWSPSSRRTYRCLVAVNDSIDPAANYTKWEPLGFPASVSLVGNDIDLSKGNSFFTTVSSNRTFTVSNLPPAGYRCELALRIWHTGGVFTLPAGSVWSEGLVPQFVLNRMHRLYMITDDGGATKHWSALPNFPA